MDDVLGCSVTRASIIEDLVLFIIYSVQHGHKFLLAAYMPYS